MGGGAAATAACELTNAVGFGFRPLSTFTPSTSTCCFTTTSFHKKEKKIYEWSVSCSLVNKQQQSSDQVLFNQDENLLIEALIGIQGRGRSASPQQLQEVERAVQVLEASQSITDPTSSSLIEGRWQLMFTTRPGTASPIQRTFVGVDFFKVFQEVYLQTDDQRVSNIVKFSDAIGELKVEAAASVKDGKRILFRFDKAAFSFEFLPFKVPYPVPFKLLGDEAKGWLDTTYLSNSGNLRISKGNKEIEDFLAMNRNAAKGEQQLLEGEWNMIWSSQMETDSWIENAANGLMGAQIVKGNGELKFLVDILLGLKFSMTGTYLKSGANLYEVTMDDAAILAGQYGLPVEIESKFILELLYADNKLRITKGYKNTIFVHVRVEGANKK